MVSVSMPLARMILPSTRTDGGDPTPMCMSEALAWTIMASRVSIPGAGTRDPKPGKVPAQRQIGDDTDSFAQGLRSGLRQDPDVVEEKLEVNAIVPT